jgi:hypothetical protein
MNQLPPAGAVSDGQTEDLNPYHIDKQAQLKPTGSKVSLEWRTAALVVVIERVAQVALERGIWP